MEKKMETIGIIYRFYRNYRVYVGALLGELKIEWKLLFRV